MEYLRVLETSDNQTTSDWITIQWFFQIEEIGAMNLEESGYYIYRLVLVECM
jgi:hypothetical protein